jgi:hypothetical protein
MDKRSASKSKKLQPFLIQITPNKQKQNSQGSIASSIDTSVIDENKRFGKWTTDEDELLLNAVEIYGTKNWKLVSKAVSGRNQVQCLHRWTKILQPGLTKGPWSIEEDRKLMLWVKKEGPNKWTTCAEYIKGRSGKQCRERWLNTLNPNVKKGNWEPEEDYLIFKLFSQFGSQWSKINMYFDKRTENSIKNRFYSTLRRINAEKKKENSSLIEPNISSKTKLDSLLKYIPDAIKEKTQKLMSKNPHHELLANVNLDYIEYIHEESKEEYKEREVINMMPLIQIEEKIEDVCMNPADNNIVNDNGFFDDDNIGFLDNQISNFLDNLFESANDKNCNLSFLHDEKFEDIETDSNININNVNINDNITSMVQQLSTLEELLLNTKNQILAGSGFSETQKVLTK